MPFHQRRGFSLVEVLIALVVLSVAAMGLVATMYVAGTASADAQDYALALGVCTEQLDLAVTQDLAEALDRLTGSDNVEKRLSIEKLQEHPQIGKFVVPGLRGTGDDLDPDHDPRIDPDQSDRHRREAAPGIVEFYLLSTDSEAVEASLLGIRVRCDWIGASGRPYRINLSGFRSR